MSTERLSPQLPAYTAGLRLAKRGFAAALGAALIAGTLSSVDALYASLSRPSNTVAVTANVPFEISGTLPDSLDAQAVALGRGRLSLEIEPETAHVAVNSVEIAKRKLLFGYRWHATLMILPPAAAGVYTATATLTNGHTIALDPWRIEIYPSRAKLDEHSPSIIRRWFGRDPLGLAIRALVVALAAAAGYQLLLRWLTKIFADNGFLRVYHAKPDGDDTLLYCIDGRGAIEAHRAYPVYSAAGQLLGTAEVAETSSRYCVLRLNSARARAGCVIALPDASDGE